MKNWYRVELDASGNVVSVTLQSKAGVSTHTVVYVEAKGQDDAGRKAMNLYARRKVRQTRAKYKAEGKCPCGRERDDESMVTCAVCRSNHAASLERARMRARPDGTKLRLASSASRTRDRRAEMRHEVLCELQMKLSVFQSVGAVRVWVQQEIRKLQGLPEVKSVGASKGRGA